MAYDLPLCFLNCLCIWELETMLIQYYIAGIIMGPIPLQMGTQ